MDTTITDNPEQEKLLRMSPISSEKNLKEDNIIILNEPTKKLERKSPTEIKQQTFLLNLCSGITRILSSIHLPHLSDSTLRTIFLFFIILIGLSSFTVALIIGSSVMHFKQQCVLYATFQYKTYLTHHSNWTVKIIPLTEGFSSQSTCDFCTFFNVFTFIYCIMTGFFFILFNGDPRIISTNDRCLIIPWFPISLILTFFSLINASILTNGFLKFCSTITSNDSGITSCTQLNQLYFEQYPNVSLFFTYMLVSIICSWLQLTFFIGIITILTIRLATSFDWNNDNDDELNEKPIMMKSMEQTEN